MPPESSLPNKAHRSGNSAEFRAECVSFFAEAVQVFGVPKSVGQIYGLLFASPSPLSFSDIVARLEISKGSASQGLQLLRSLGAIKTAAEKPYTLHLTPCSSAASAPRRVAYEPELGLRRLMSGILQERLTPLAAAGAGRITRLRELAERDGDSFNLDRVEQLETWRRRLKTVLPVLSVLLGPKSRK